jgi:hypothetical protein
MLPPQDSISPTLLAPKQNLWLKQFLMILSATEFGNHVFNYDSVSKNCHLKYKVKFDQKCWWNRTAFLTPFTLCWHHCTLHKMVGEIDPRLTMEVNDIR